MKIGANGLDGVNGLSIRTEKNGVKKKKNGVILKTMIPIEKNGVAHFI